VTNDDDEIVFPDRWQVRLTRPAHEKHSVAEVGCESCHGPLGNVPFVKPRSAPLMKRCVSCHEEHEAPLECTTCHPADIQPPHVDIVLDHAEEQRGCLDCHDERDRDQLRLVNGDPVSFAESYRLCGQCHGPKLRDWKLGLHGKRTGEWDGVQEYRLCANCHSPHSPQYRAMIPMRRPARPGEVR
jgi:hypothetical protein